MINSILLNLLLGFSVYFVIGFYFLRGQKGKEQVRVSVFNPYEKINYQTTLREKYHKRVISREEYEWLKAE